MRDYRKYEVWQDAHQFTLLVYKTIVPLLPVSEQYGLTSQLRRATYSIALNIVEGCGRNTDKDFVHFLDMALGSSQEVEYCLLLLSDLGFINEKLYVESFEAINEIKAKLINLIKTIRKQDS